MPVSRFGIIAQADPQALPRIINFFAQLGLMPRRIRAEAAHGLVTIRIEQPNLSEHQTQVIAEKMRSSILIETVWAERDDMLQPDSETTDALSA